MTDAVLAVPGDIATPTGGYGYARRVLAEAGAAGWGLSHLPLPDGFPLPSAAALAEAGRRLTAVPAGTALIVDGLAYGVLPPRLIDEVQAPLVALCHHPLARETGLTPEVAARLAGSERAALARARVVIASSAATAADLAENFGVAQVEIARPGTDPQPPAAGSGGPGVVILSVGTLIPRKGHARLVRALARIADLHWRCMIVGALNRDPAETARVRALIDELGLGGRVELAGPMEEKALGRLYHRADVFALASEHEGFGMAYAEAVARGLPTVGPRIAAVAEATAGGAWLAAPGDDAAYAEALRGLVSDAGLRARWSARAREAAVRLPRWPETLAAIRRAAERAGGL